MSSQHKDASAADRDVADSLVVDNLGYSLGSPAAGNPAADSLAAGCNPGCNSAGRSPAVAGSPDQAAGRTGMVDWDS